MFSNLLRQQARLSVSSARLSRPAQQAIRPLAAVQRSQILSQRTFSVSRSIFEEDRPSRNNWSEDSNAERFPARPKTFPNRTLYVGNLPYSTDEGEIRSLFESYGDIERVTIATTPEGLAKGFAHVQFAQEADAKAALESNEEEPFELTTRKLNINMAKPPRAAYPNARRSKDAGEPTKTLHIANFPIPGDERCVREAFENFEKDIVRVTFMKSYDGKPSEKGFVQFTDVSTATEALNAMQEVHYEGKNLKLYYAKEKFESPRRQNRSYDA